MFARTSAALAAMIFVGTAASTAPRISIFTDYLKCTWKYKSDLKPFVKVLKSRIFANNLGKKDFFSVVPFAKTILALSEKLKFYKASKV